MKLARNSQLMYGIEVKLTVYLKAESTSNGLCMIGIANGHDAELVNSFCARAKIKEHTRSTNRLYYCY